MHRFTELYIQLISLYGHALFISHINFEVNHQRVKATLTRRTHCSSQIFAVQNILCKDWIQKVCNIWALEKVNLTDQTLREEPLGDLCLEAMLQANSVPNFLKNNT